MKAMLIPVAEMPRVIEIDNSLKGLQDAVGGYIEPCSWVFDNKPAIYVNEEGKFTCSPNRAVYATAEDEGAIRWDGSTIKRGDLLEILFGDIVCVGFNPDTDEERDITDEEIEAVMTRFGTDESIGSGLRETIKIINNRA